MPEIHKIYEAEGDPQLTVIFIHGSGGHFVRTWGPLNQVDNWLFWIGPDLKSADVFSVQHEADVASLLDYSTLEEYADAVGHILGELVRTKRVLFICHSLGGLLAKQIMVNSFEQERHSQMRGKEIDVSFLATPHSGADFPIVRRLLALIIRNKLWPLVLSRNREIEQLNAKFLALPNYMLRNLFNVSERRRFVGIKLMNAKSSAINDPRSVNLAVSKNHKYLCKFQNRGDIIYRTILSMARGALSRKLMVSDGSFLLDTAFLSRILDEPSDR